VLKRERVWGIDTQGKKTLQYREGVWGMWRGNDPGSQKVGRNGGLEGGQRGGKDRRGTSEERKMC